MGAGCSTSKSLPKDGNDGTDGTEPAGKGGRSEGTDGKDSHGELYSLGPGLEGPASFLFGTWPTLVASELDALKFSEWGFTSPPDPETAQVPINTVNTSEKKKPISETT